MAAAQPGNGGSALASRLPHPRIDGGLGVLIGLVLVLVIFAARAGKENELPGAALTPAAAAGDGTGEPASGEKQARKAKRKTAAGPADSEPALAQSGDGAGAGILGGVVGPIAPGGGDRSNGDSPDEPPSRIRRRAGGDPAPPGFTPEPGIPRDGAAFPTGDHARHPTRRSADDATSGSEGAAL